MNAINVGEVINKRKGWWYSKSELNSIIRFTAVCYYIWISTILIFLIPFAIYQFFFQLFSLGTGISEIYRTLKENISFNIWILFYFFKNILTYSICPIYTRVFLLIFYLTFLNFFFFLKTKITTLSRFYCCKWQRNPFSYLRVNIWHRWAVHSRRQPEPSQPNLSFTRWRWCWLEWCWFNWTSNNGCWCIITTRSCWGCWW